MAMARFVAAWNWRVYPRWSEVPRCWSRALSRCRWCSGQRLPAVVILVHVGSMQTFASAGISSQYKRPHPLTEWSLRPVGAR